MPYTKEQKAKWYRDNRERIARRQAQYQQQNRERISQRKKDYYLANREERLSYARAYRQA